MGGRCLESLLIDLCVLWLQVAVLCVAEFVALFGAQLQLPVCTAPQLREALCEQAHASMLVTKLAIGFLNAASTTSAVTEGSAAPINALTWQEIARQVLWKQVWRGEEKIEAWGALSREALQAVGELGDTDAVTHEVGWYRSPEDEEADLLCRWLWTEVHPEVVEPTM